MGTQKLVGWRSSQSRDKLKGWGNEGSIPSGGPKWAHSSVVRAFALHAKGPPFKSECAHWSTIFLMPFGRFFH